MFDLFNKRSVDQVLADFKTSDERSPFRCTLCSQMQPAGSTLAWVADSAGYFRGRETYESLVNGGKTSHLSGACISCLRKAP